jgi:hypothetical protein
MPEDPIAEAGDLIEEAGQWIKNTRQFANAPSLPDDTRIALGKLYDIAQKQNRALELLKKVIDEGLNPE